MSKDKTESAGTNRHSEADQGEVAAVLEAPETHGVERVERIDTHVSMVFIAGDKTYKVMRAVRFPYLDFTTLQARKTACEAEVRLNRRTAPRLYLGVTPILCGLDGHLSLGEVDQRQSSEDIVEWAVAMHTFDQAGLFDRLAEAGKLTPELLVKLAASIRRFHAEAEKIPRGGTARGGAEGMAVTLAENHEELSERPDLFDAESEHRLNSNSEVAIQRLAPLLDRRWDEGWVRRCHGDLHLRNICLFDGEPTLFDAIEFSDAISCIDVLYDLAFLLMDLDQRDLRAGANLVLNRYLQPGLELEALAALPLFLSVRAGIRAKVAGASEANQADATARAATRKEARRYFAAAQDYLSCPPPHLLAIGGYSGSGKSTVARRLAPAIGARPGAIHLRSDVIRKALFDVDELTALPKKAYRAAVSGQVYGLMLERAKQALDAGHAVILDAVYADPGSRAAVEQLARDTGVGFTGIWLDAPEARLVERASTRRADASDATAEVVRRQLSGDPRPISWHRLDADRPIEAIAAEARALIDG